MSEVLKKKQLGINTLFQNKNFNFYFLLLFSLLVVFASQPFLRYPYDPWYFLINIENLYNYNELPFPPVRELWYSFWVFIFKIVSVEDVFLRAKIIHSAQTIVALSSVFFFSHVLLRNLFKEMDSISLKYLSYWSSVIWLTIFATFSVNYHQIWIMWYSQTLQISLAFFWYISALSIIIFVENRQLLIKCVYILLILFFSYIILSIHPMEIVYFLMYFLLLCIIYFNKILAFVKAHYGLLVLFILIFGGVLYYYFSFYYKDNFPLFVNVLRKGDFLQLHQLILKNGQMLIDGLNRSSAAINELMRVIVFISVFLIYDVFREKVARNESAIDLRLLLFTVISALFITIPLFQYSSGIASIISKLGVVNRIYYCSSIFILLPISVYYFGMLFSKNMTAYKINVSMIVILSLTLLYSAKISHSKNYYKNVKSFVDSFDENKVGFHLSPENIKQIGALLIEYEKNIDLKNKPAIYFARADIAYIIKYIYKREVFWYKWGGGRRNVPLTEERFNRYLKNNKLYETKTAVVFKTPNGFPEYIPYK